MTSSVTPKDEEARRGGLQAVVRHLLAWSAALPDWSPDGVENRAAFDRRRRRSERVLTAKLLRLPGCQVALSSDHHQADLALAGIRVRSEWGLRGACEAWALKARAPLAANAPSFG